MERVLKLAAGVLMLPPLLVSVAFMVIGVAAGAVSKALSEMIVAFMSPFTD